MLYLIDCSNYFKIFDPFLNFKNIKDIGQVHFAPKFKWKSHWSIFDGLFQLHKSKFKKIKILAQSFRKTKGFGYCSRGYAAKVFDKRTHTDT